MTDAISTSSPYYIHPSDNPGAVLVSHLLNDSGTNYGSWSRAMTIALGAKNKLGFVDGSINKPEEDSANHAVWVRSNHMTTSWILNSIAKELHCSMIYADFASAIWKELKNRFEQSNCPRIFQMNKEVLNCTQGTLTVSAYFSKFKGLWDSLAEHTPANTCTCGGSAALVKSLNRQHVMIFLMGLNDSFSHTRGQILLMDPIPDINKVFSLIVQEEKQREVGLTTTDTSSQLTYAVNSQSKGGKRDRPQCSHCGMMGHIKEKCFKLNGYPPGFKKSKPSTTQQQVMQVTAGNTTDNLLAPQQ